MTTKSIISARRGGQGFLGKAILFIIFVLLAGFGGVWFSDNRSADEIASLRLAKEEAVAGAVVAKEEGFEEGYLESAWDTYKRKNRYAFDESDTGAVTLWKREDVAATRLKQDASDKPKTPTSSISSMPPLIPAVSLKESPKREILPLTDKSSAEPVVSKK